MEIEGQPAICWTAQMASQTGWPVIVLTDNMAVVAGLDGICPSIFAPEVEPCNGTERCSMLLDLIAESLGAVPQHIVIVAGDELTAPPDCIKSLYVPGEISTAVMLRSSYSHASISNDGYINYVSRHAIGRYEASGLYGCPTELLAKYAGWGQSPNEIREGIELLRWIDNGQRVKAVVRPDLSGLTLNTRDDADMIAAWLRHQGN
jgi:CMP-2-keto-3-deoxyoctulosonic acid synthetase